MSLNFGQNMFPPQPERAIASFDFVDIAEGTGEVDFVGFYTAEGSGAGLIKTQTGNLESSPLATTSGSTFINNASPNNFSSILEMNFDTPEFNRPLVLRGTGFFKAMWDLRHDNGVPPVSGALILNLQKIRDNITTRITTVSGAIESFDLTGVTKQYKELMQIKVPKTSIKKGDQIRANVHIYGESDASDMDIKLYHEVGTDISDNLLTSAALRIRLPFDINL